MLFPYRILKKLASWNLQNPNKINLWWEIDPPYPLFWRWGQSICIFWDGSSPLKVPAKKTINENEFGKNSDLGDESSMRFGNFGDEWDRRGSEWADTLGKRRRVLQEGF